MKDFPVIVLGGGGHAKVLIDTLLNGVAPIIGIADPFLEKHTKILGVPVIGDDAVVFQYIPEEVRLVNGVGSIGTQTRRRELFCQFKHRGYYFDKVIHPSAILSGDIFLSEGVQIMAGAVIQAGSRIGQNTIVNTRASVDHDCNVQDHVHLAPGVVLSGGVYVGTGTHIGTGAIVVQGVRVGENCLIGAGAVVVKDVVNNTKVLGVPAKEVEW